MIVLRFIFFVLYWAVFFTVNYFYFFDDYPPVFYPITAIVFVLVFILFYRRSGMETDGNLSPAIPLTLTDTVPKDRMQNELDMAKRVQQGLLSVESPSIPGYKIVKKCSPAESVGGDFYTFISQDFTSLSPNKKSPGIVEYYDQHDTHLGIAIGDVAGHGVSSALIMALSSGIIGEKGKQHRSPQKTLKQSNKELLRYIENSQITHVTVCYGVLNTATKRFKYAKGGHPPIIMIRQDSSLHELNSDGVFLGMFPNASYEEKELQLREGDRLFFYTDGIHETKNTSGEIFGLDRLKSFIQHHLEKPIEVVIELLFDELDKFSNFQLAKDDRTMVILEVE